MWIRKHKNGTVVCQASNRANLHSKYGEQLGLSDDYADIEQEFAGRVGDLADGTPQPENYPKPTKEELVKQSVSGYREKAVLVLARQEALNASDDDAVAELNKQIGALGI